MEKRKREKEKLKMFNKSYFGKDLPDLAELKTRNSLSI